MRDEKRIDDFFELLAEQWKKESADLRFAQFLQHHGLKLDCYGHDKKDVFYMEEYDILKTFFPEINISKYKKFNEYRETADSKFTKYLIAGMKAENINNLLKQHYNNTCPLSEDMVNILENTLRDLMKKVDSN
jgi:hypothetical protein